MEGCVDMRRCSLGQRFGRERSSPAFINIVPQLPVISNFREMHDQRMFLPHQHQVERKGRQLGLTVHIKINDITLLPSHVRCDLSRMQTECHQTLAAYLLSDRDGEQHIGRLLPGR